jgi:hypothetical protein
MKRTMKLIVILALLALLLIPASPALAKGPLDGGPVIFGGDYKLNSGDTLNSDLVVFGGNVLIEEGGLVKGSIVVFGGTVTMNGTMEADLVLIGGTGSLGEKAVVGGDLVTVGGSISRAEGAVVKGETRTEAPIEIPAPNVPQVPNAPEPPNVNINPIGSAVQTMVMAIVMGALAMLLVLFIHPQMDRVAQAFVHQPLIAGGAGLLVILLTFTLIVIPVYIVLLPLAWVLGITSLGMEVGDRFTRAIGQSWSPTLSAGFGTFMLMLVVGGIGITPCVGWTVPFLVGLVGIGSVALTVFGSRAYPPATGAPAAGPVEPLPPPA